MLLLPPFPYFPRFPDIRNDYQRSEISMDFNAGFTSAAAGLASHDHNRKTRTCSNTGTGEGTSGVWRSVEGFAHRRVFWIEPSVANEIKDDGIDGYVASKHSWQVVCCALASCPDGPSPTHPVVPT